jgi:O-antigen/teichoic acid export membrane protein
MAVLVTSAVTMAYSFWLFAKASSGSWRPQYGPLPAFVLRAAPLSWAQVLQLRIDQFAIALLVPADPTAFGAYVVGTTLAGMVSPVAQGLALVLLPESARRAKADAVQLFGRMGRFFVLAAAVLAVPVAVAAPWLLTLFYGPEFAAGAYALRIGLLAAVLAGLFAMGLSTIQGEGRPGTAAIIGTLCCMISVAGSVVMLPLLGYLGAALGQTLGLLVGLSLIVAVYRSEGLTVLSFVPRFSDVMSLQNAAARVFRRKRDASPCATPTEIDKPAPMVPAAARDPLYLRGDR